MNLSLLPLSYYAKLTGNIFHVRRKGRMGKRVAVCFPNCRPYGVRTHISTLRGWRPTISRKDDEKNGKHFLAGQIKSLLLELGCCVLSFFGWSAGLEPTPFVLQTNDNGIGCWSFLIQGFTTENGCYEVLPLHQDHHIMYFIYFPTRGRSNPHHV